jgi:hypothetical protein
VYKPVPTRSVTTTYISESFDITFLFELERHSDIKPMRPWRSLIARPHKVSIRPGSILAL